MFTEYPVYKISSGESVSVEFHSKKVIRYDGDISLKNVSVWLEDVSAPILSDVVSTKTAGRLKKALAGKLPLIVLVNRDGKQQAAYDAL